MRSRHRGLPCPPSRGRAAAGERGRGAHRRVDGAGALGVVLAGRRLAGSQVTYVWPLQHHDPGRGPGPAVPIHGAAAEPATAVQRRTDTAGSVPARNRLRDDISPAVPKGAARLPIAAHRVLGWSDRKLAQSATRQIDCHRAARSAASTVSMSGRTPCGSAASSALQWRWWRNGPREARTKETALSMDRIRGSRVARGRPPGSRQPVPGLGLLFGPFVLLEFG